MYMRSSRYNQNQNNAAACGEKTITHAGISPAGTSPKRSSEISASNNGVGRPRFEITPPRLLIISFLSVIAAGAFLLYCPFAAQPKIKISFIDALFTAVSAVCVTGLTTLDTASSFSTAGQIIILSLIQFGGLGIMTIVTFAMSTIGGRVSLKTRLFAREDRPSSTSIDLIELIKYVLIITTAIEGTGAALLYIVFHFQKGYSHTEAAYMSVFHSISAFCNAGFALFSDSLCSFDGHIALNIVVITLIILGGLGFNAIVDLIYFVRAKTRYQLSLNTKLALWTTFILLAAGAVSILAIEYNNPDTIGKFPFYKKTLASFFQSVTLRTAGFNTIDCSKLLPPAIFLSMLLMFIGASPGGTGGGIKTTTAAVLFKSIMRSIHDETQITAFNRAVPKESISRAIAVFTISMFLVFTGVFILLFSEKLKFIEILFEVISAFGTVGLSLGATSKLSAFGKLIIASIMFSGRVGSLTVVIALSQSKVKLDIRYPEETVLIG